MSGLSGWVFNYSLYSNISFVLHKMNKVLVKQKKTKNHYSSVNVRLKPNLLYRDSGSVNGTRKIRILLRFGTKGTRSSGSVRCSAEMFGFVCTLEWGFLNDGIPNGNFEGSQVS